MKSILIKDTTREERIRIVQEGLNQCREACDMCGLCTVFRSMDPELVYADYISGKRSYFEVSADYK